MKWLVTNAEPSIELAALLVDTNGIAVQFRWTINDPPIGSCYSYPLSDRTGQLAVDNNCDGIVDSSLAAAIQSVTELAPRVIAVVQDPLVLAGRPAIPCSTVPFDPRNYGTVLAVLFSKPMTQGGVDVASAYTLENGNHGNSVQIQPGARVALLNMAQPVGALRQRTMTVNGVTDPRGNLVTQNSGAVNSVLTAGTSIRGRVVRADGSSAAGLPVTLTYYDLDGSGFDCVSFIVRASQVFTDADGFFSFDFVVSGIPYSISATDTSGLSTEAIRILLESFAGDALARDKLTELLNNETNRNNILADFNSVSLPQAIAKAEGLDRAVLRDLVPLNSPREGTESIVALRFRGRGVVTGQVLAADGTTPLSGVAVNLFPIPIRAN